MAGDYSAWLNRGAEGRSLMTLVLLIGAFLALLTEVSTNIAFPLFMEKFHVSVSAVQWLTTGFMLVMSAVLPASAFIMKRFRTRRIFFSAMFLLIAGTVLSGAAFSFAALLAGRLLQAAGTCVSMALLMNCVLILTPVHRRGAAMGAVSLVLLFAPAVAPTLAGLVIHASNWRMIYLGLAPFFIVLSAAAWFVLDDIHETERVGIDVLSLVLSTVSFVCILYGISCAGEEETGAWTVAAFLGAGLVSLSLFSLRQFWLEDPLVDLRVFCYPMFSLGVVLIILNMIMLFSVLVYAPMFLQAIYGLSPSQAGLVMLPAGFLGGALSPFIGRLFDRVGPKPLIMTGVVLLGSAGWAFSRVGASSGTAAFIAVQCLYLTGTTMIMAPSQTNGLNQIPRHLYPHGTAVFTTLMQLGGGLGTALFVNISSVCRKGYLAHAQTMGDEAQRAAMLHGFQSAFLVLELAVTAAFVITLFLRRSVTEERLGSMMKEC